MHRTSTPRPFVKTLSAGLVGVALLLGGVALAGGSSSANSASAPADKLPTPAPASKRPNWTKSKEHGMKVSWDKPGAIHISESENGRHIRIAEKVSVTVPGKGKRNLTAEIEDQPVARGGRQATAITDTTTDSRHTFAYDPATNSITIFDGATTVTIVQNPDHSYSVDGQAAATGSAAVDLLALRPAYQSLSPHQVYYAYLLAKRPKLATKGTTSCTLPDCSESCGDGFVATPPSVCTQFSDLCECMVCDQAGKGRACAKCK